MDIILTVDDWDINFIELAAFVYEP